VDRTTLLARVTQALAARPEVLDAYVFGSVARDEAQPHSDVDVAVYLDPSAPVPEWGHAAALGTELMAALGRNDVDVVVLNQATPLLYHRVLRDGVRVVSRDLKKTTTREGYAMSRYCDDLGRQRIVERAAAERQAKGAYGR
jgi:predicted nucleotidyltransferase